MAPKFRPFARYLSSVAPKSEDQTATFLATTLQQHIKSGAPSRGQTIHAHILKTGFPPNTNVSIKILILYLRCGCLRYARQLFDEMPRRTLSAYNFLIGGYLRRGLAGDAVGLVRQLVGDGERPDGVTLSMVLKASGVGGGGDVGLPRNVGGVVHGQVVKWDVECDDVMYSVLVDSYVKSGKVGYARRVFDSMADEDVVCATSVISGYMNQGDVGAAEEIFFRMAEKDVVVYNAMIEGYSKSTGTAEKALEVYVHMQRVGFRPTLATFSSVVGACSMLGGFEIGQQVQGQLVKSDFLDGVKMGSALIDLYSKCGRTDEALRVFNQMPERNVFSWTSMIDGYGKNGKPKEALELFDRMQRNGMEPNNVTFLAALTACAHAGLVLTGREILESMARDYSMDPRMEHCACMVDLLGRSGSLDQAWDFVMGMPKEPNADVWAVLLSSCNLHGQMDMARIAANELFKLNATGRPGAYVSLSNTFAASGKWDNVDALRETMMSRGILKEKARSWTGTAIDHEVSSCVGNHVQSYQNNS